MIEFFDKLFSVLYPKPVCEIGPSYSASYFEAVISRTTSCMRAR